ncbi:hypothetical protein Acsp04_58840 [Actinomadura sp. NBRC 104425]|uniref:hypothetical protein n=1 Tax=Actinomadura sp. NBRC 104425 TaxID=3032204 RepID=UPI0024A53EEF|nr:hypothetical protein [Actinomadura sp. NBRC 104425]GLZ15649.1 hypothetical protein Acsp04_58840 [Actinomadura sp. NBRC 104425]
MNTQIPSAGAPDPDDVSRGLAELERHLAEVADATATDGAELEDAPSGETRRVRRLRAEVAEAHLLAELYQDDTPLTIDSPRVRKRRRKVAEAHRLHELSRDPRALAWQAARVRRIAIGASMTALGLALGWSTVGVQAFAADGAPTGSAVWWFGWTVEPFLSLALLSIVGVRAFLGAHGQPVASRKLNWLEGLFLSLTVFMNAWPHLPGVADTFAVERLVVHLIGPIVAVAIVTGLPVILAALSRLDIDDLDAPYRPLTGPEYRGNAPTGPVVETDSGKAGRADEEADAIRQTLELIRSGELPENPSANAIRQRLGCGMTRARAIRDALQETRGR